MLKEEKNEAYCQYLDEIASVIASNEAIARSGNIVIDSLLNFKDYEFRQNNIKLELFLKIPQEIDLPAFELAAVFGNLVDNAIEDCKTVDGERVIVVRVLQKRGVLQMSVKNTFDGIIKIEDGKMLSRKRNYRERGAGLDRVSEIVDRYNGLLEYETVDAAFSVRLIIYLLH
ncbi:MAG: hypothetical protein PWP16_888 [Eubacteriaceae bacterium]|nr:hypothetical protein [Eubacteriaceae bacterium]MDN5307525.1 hypothetical protein [Eubacteriaceae bacterium]